MLAFIARRIFFIALVCVLIIFFAHLGMLMIGNSDASRPNYDLGVLSGRAWAQSQGYLSDLISGSMGAVTTQYGLQRVSTLLRDAYSKSMGLLLVSLLAASVLGLMAGAYTAVTGSRAWVLPLMILTILGMSTPSYFAGLLLRNGELLFLRVFGYPLVSMAGFGWDYKHMLLPVLVLSARPLAYLTRAAFLAFDGVMDEDYIRTAFSKGLDRVTTVNVHALKNVAVPVLTAVGVSLRFSLSTLPIVEFLFVWPGMGLKMLEAINQRQTPMVVGLALALGVTFLLINLLLDVAYRVIDPRLREI